MCCAAGHEGSRDPHRNAQGAGFAGERFPTFTGNPEESPSSQSVSILSRPQDGKSVTYKQGTDVTLHTDYTFVGDSENIALSYSSLPLHVRQGALERQETPPKSPLTCRAASGSSKARAELDGATRRE